MNSVVPSGSYISEIVKVSTRLSTTAESLGDGRDSTGRRFWSLSCRPGRVSGVDVVEISARWDVAGTRGNVARIKMGDDLSCASSPCKEQDISPNTSQLLQFSLYNGEKGSSVSSRKNWTVALEIRETGDARIAERDRPKIRGGGGRGNTKSHPLVGRASLFPIKRKIPLVPGPIGLEFFHFAFSRLAGCWTTCAPQSTDDARCIPMKSIKSHPRR